LKRKTKYRSESKDFEIKGLNERQKKFLRKCNINFDETGSRAMFTEREYTRACFQLMVYENLI